MLVSNKIKKFKYIVIALVGNKNDLYEYKEVTDEEGLAFADEINAIFKTVSAKTGLGIDDLFNTMGKTFLYKLNHDIINYHAINHEIMDNKTINHPKKQTNFDNKLNIYLNY